MQGTFKNNVKGTLICNFW